MTEFDPVLYSEAENKFLYEYAGQPPIVAMRAVPTGVNRTAVRPVLERIYELVELEKHVGAEWVGVPAIQQAIRTYLEQAEKWALDRRPGRPRFPSMHTYDSKGRPHRGGPGSDSGQVRTYFTADGKRQPFAVELITNVTQEWSPEWTAADQSKDGIPVDMEKRRMECSICGHTESFNSESRGSFNAARARMSKHLRTATDEASAHRELHTKEFS